MPWGVKKGGGSCKPSQWAVLNKATGRTMGCHPSRKKAVRQLAALNANVREGRVDLFSAAADLLEADRKRQKLRALRRIVGTTEARVGRLFRRQGRAFVAELGDLRPTWEAWRLAPPNLREAPHPDEWDRRWERAASRIRADFADALKDAHEGALAAGGAALAAHLELDISFDLQNPRAIAWVEAHGAGLVKGIDETSRAYMRTILTDAVSKGWSYSRTARAIRERFDGFSIASPLAHIQSRAELVAVTETAQAYEAGNRLMAEQLRGVLPAGVGIEKAWLTVGDERVDEEQCGPNEAEGWIPMDESHTSGHGEPPAHPGCRCTEMYQTVRSRA